MGDSKQNPEYPKAVDQPGGEEGIPGIMISAAADLRDMLRMPMEERNRMRDLGFNAYHYTDDDKLPNTPTHILKQYSEFYNSPHQAVNYTKHMDPQDIMTRKVAVDSELARRANPSPAANPQMLHELSQNVNKDIQQPTQTKYVLP